MFVTAVFVTAALHANDRAPNILTSAAAQAEIAAAIQKNCRSVSFIKCGYRLRSGVTGMRLLKTHRRLRILLLRDMKLRVEARRVARAADSEEEIAPLPAAVFARTGRRLAPQAGPVMNAAPLVVGAAGIAARRLSAQAATNSSFGSGASCLEASTGS